MASSDQMLSNIVSLAAALPGSIFAIGAINMEPMSKPFLVQLVLLILCWAAERFIQRVLLQPSTQICECPGNKPKTAHPLFLPVQVNDLQSMARHRRNSKLLSQGRFSPTKQAAPSFISTLLKLHQTPIQFSCAEPDRVLQSLSTRPLYKAPWASAEDIQLSESPHGMVNKDSYINLDPGSSVALELDELERLWVSREEREAGLRDPRSYFNLDPGTSVALNLNNLEQLWVNREKSGVSVYDSHGQCLQ